MALDNILVAGAGALGALYGHKFIAAGKKTLFLADGKRKERLEKDGIVVNGRHFDISCTGGNREGFRPDLVLVAVKYHNLEEIAYQAAPFVKDDTIIVSVMNGIDSEEILKNRLGRGKMMLTVALGMDAVRKDNSTEYTKEGKLFFNRYDSSVSDNDIRLVSDLFTTSGIAHETADDIWHIMWFKFMINTGINQVSSVLNANYRFMRENPYAREIMDSVMNEVIAVANAEGVRLDESDLQHWYRILDSLGPEGKTSMCQDVEAGRKTEVEMFSGKMRELGKKHNIDVTINRVMYNLIKAKEDFYLQTGNP